MLTSLNILCVQDTPGFHGEDEALDAVVDYIAAQDAAYEAMEQVRRPDSRRCYTFSATSLRMCEWLMRSLAESLRQRRQARSCPVMRVGLRMKLCQKRLPDGPQYNHDFRSGVACADLRVDLCRPIWPLDLPS